MCWISSQPHNLGVRCEGYTSPRECGCMDERKSSKWNDDVTGISVSNRAVWSVEKDEYLCSSW